MSQEPTAPTTRWTSDLAWYLVAGDQQLGTLTATELDQPWVYCDFAPTAAFAPLRPLFDAEVALIDHVETDAGFEAWATAYTPIEALALLLVPDRGGAPLEHFLIHIQGTRAWFRLP